MLSTHAFDQPPANIVRCWIVKINDWLDLDIGNKKKLCIQIDIRLNKPNKAFKTMANQKQCLQTQLVSISFIAASHTTANRSLKRLFSLVLNIWIWYIGVRELCFIVNNFGDGKMRSWQTIKTYIFCWNRITTLLIQHILFEMHTKKCDHVELTSKNCCALMTAFIKSVVFEQRAIHTISQWFNWNGFYWFLLPFLPRQTAYSKLCDQLLLNILFQISCQIIDELWWNVNKKNTLACVCGWTRKGLMIWITKNHF